MRNTYINCWLLNYTKRKGEKPASQFWNIQIIFPLFLTQVLLRTFIGQTQRITSLFFWRFQYKTKIAFLYPLWFWAVLNQSFILYPLLHWALWIPWDLVLHGVFGGVAALILPFSFRLHGNRSTKTIYSNHANGKKSCYFHVIRYNNFITSSATTLLHLLLLVILLNQISYVFLCLVPSL